MMVLYWIEPKPHRLNQDLLDRVLVARLSLDPNEPNDEYPEDIRAELQQTHFDYLLSSWKRAQEIKRNTLTRSKVPILMKRPCVLCQAKHTENRTWIRPCSRNVCLS